MSIVLESLNNKKEFNKSLINVGSNPKCDFVVKPGFEFLMTIQYDKQNQICTVNNNVNSQNIICNGKVLQKIVVTGYAKIELRNSTEYIIIQVGEDISIDSDYSMKVSLSEEDLTELYGASQNNSMSAKIELLRQPIEKARIAIMKQILYPITELKSKISTQVKTNIFLHVALFVTCWLSSFALANYLIGLPVQEAAGYVYLASNIPVWLGYSFVVFAICLMLKQGTFMHLSGKRVKSHAATDSIAKNFMLITSLLFIGAIYVVNLVYYFSISDFFVLALFLTVFFIGAMTVLAVTCGYFKEDVAVLKSVLRKYEFREDFEEVQKAYRIWIERYINNFTEGKINTIKERLANLQVKAAAETLVGLITVPFMAYGVSNTLAMCFPEFAGWIRFGNMRFSPVFLVLAAFLIVFAFFMFVSAFVTEKKIKASEIIKHDGFFDFRYHGVSIYGLEGVKKLESDKNRFFYAAVAIVIIEFTMNISYFMNGGSGEIKGVFMNFLVATVPTAILVTEAIWLASSKFDIYVNEELIAKLDNE